MRRTHQDTTEVHECAFQATIAHTNAAVKFSCKMFLAWKSMTNKIFCRTVNDNVSPHDGIATFNQNLSFQTYLLYDKTTSSYLRKETSLCLMLVSARKPDQEKLVGRVVVDLAQILNSSAYSQVQDHKLAFCSIPNATLTFHIRCLTNNKTDMRPLDLDMDEFSIIAKNLNQSSNSNNQDLVAFKSISKEISSKSAEKQDEPASNNQQTQEIPQFKIVEENQGKKQSVDQVHPQQVSKKQEEPEIKETQIEPEVNAQPIQIQQEEQVIEHKVEEQPVVNAPQQPLPQTNQNPIQEGGQEQREQPIQVYQQRKEQFSQKDNDVIEPNHQQAKQETPRQIEDGGELNEEPYQITTEFKQEEVNQPEEKVICQVEPVPSIQEPVQQEVTEPVELAQKQATPEKPDQPEQPKREQKQYTWYQQDPKHVEQQEKAHKQMRLNSKNSDDVSELKFQNKKLQNQNQALLELYQQANADLENERIESSKLKHQLNESNSKLAQLENEKNDIIQELLQQAQTTSRECIQLTSKLKKSESSQAQVEKLRNKLEKLDKQLQESEIQRLDTEAEALEIKYELAQLKYDLQKKDSQLRAKDQQIQRLTRQIEESKPAKIEGSERQLYRSYSIMSDKEREGYNEEIEALRRKLNRLTTDLEFTQNVKDNLSHLTHACEQFSIEKQTLMYELIKLRKQKDQLLAEKNDYQQSQYNKEKADNQNLNRKLQVVEEELRAVESELSRYETERLKLQKNIQALEQENAFMKELLAKKEEVDPRLEDNNEGQFANSLKNLQKEYESLSGLLSQKESQLFKVESQIKVKDDLINEQKDKIASLEVALAESGEQLKAQQKSVIQCKQLIASLQKEEKWMKKQLESLQKKIQTLEGQKKTKQALITSHEEKLKALKSQSQKEQLELLNKIKELEIQSGRLQKQAIQFKNVIDNLQGEKSRLQQANRQHVQQKDTLTHEIQSLKVQVKASAGAGQASRNATQPSSNALLERTISEKNAVLEMKEKQIEQMAQSMQSEALKVLELEERISRFAEKELKMRENILILEEESRKIYDIVMEKEQNEDMQALLIEEKEVELQKVRVLLDDQLLLNRIAQEELAEYKNQLIILTKAAKEQKDQQQQQNVPKPPPVTQKLAQKQKSEQADGYNQLLRLDNARIHELQEQLQRVQKQHKAEVDKMIESKLVMEHEIKLLRQEKSTSSADIQKLQEKIKELKIQVQELSQSAQQNQRKLNTATAAAKAKQEQSEKAIKEKDNQVQLLLFRIEQLQLECEQKQTTKVPEPVETPQPAKQNQVNLKKLQELVSEIEVLEGQLVSQEQEIKGLKSELQAANNTIKDMKSQIDDNEVEKMNKQLEKQFQLVRDKSKEQIKKSGIVDTNKCLLPQIVVACKNLQEIVKQRSEKDKAETIIELMVSKNATLEEQIVKIAEQRGVIQENARRLSMEFQKVKAKILKGKGSYQEKTELLVSLKPCEGKVKDLVEITQRIFDTQFETETF